MRQTLDGLRLVVATAVVLAALSPLTAHAFTLISGPAAISISPTAGLPTATFKIDGQYLNDPNNCKAGAARKFTFYWDNFSVLWTATTANCPNGSTYDTGFSPAVVPPATGNSPGAHTVSVTVTDSSGGSLPSNTAKTTYTINSPPPPPPSPSPPPPPPPSPVKSTPPQTRPSPTHSSPATTPPCVAGAVTNACPSPISSPSSTSCPAGSAMLPPAGTGGWADNMIAGAMVLAVLPIAGLALFGPGPLWAAVTRRRRLLMLLGLSAVAALTLNCTFPTNSTQPVANVSPSAPASASASSCTA